MIKCELQVLPETDQIAVREWLGKGVAQTLVRIAESKAKIKLAEAASRGMEDIEKFPNCEIASSDAVKEARRYKVFLDVLNELTIQTEPYAIAKLS